MITLSNTQINLTIFILECRYRDLLEMASRTTRTEGQPSYSSIKNEMVIIRTTINELKNS